MYPDALPCLSVASLRNPIPPSSRTWTFIFYRVSTVAFLLFGDSQTGQAFRRAAARRPTFLLAQKRRPKMRPWRVGRAMKMHDCASWLRGSLTARPCADSELARIHSGHPSGLFCASSPPRNGRLLNCTQRRCAVRRVQRMLLTLIYPPVSCRQVLDGSAACGPREGSRGFGCGTGCAFSRTRPAIADPHGFIVRATGHRVASLGYVSVRAER